MTFNEVKDTLGIVFKSFSIASSPSAMHIHICSSGKCRHVQLLDVIRSDSIQYSASPILTIFLDA